MKLFKLILLLFSICAIGQNAPVLKINDSMSLKLSHLNVKSEITGNTALTTFQMKFYNETQRTLEGELLFPLAQGQSVTNFAMDVNGKMRNAVIVEKELGRVAYESTVRQVIDPGLLELTKGNIYKARVYPILPKDYKTIEIVFEEELNIRDGKHIYNLPFNFQNPLEFIFEVSIYNVDQKPKIVKGEKYGLNFKTYDYKIVSVVNKENIVVNEDFALEIPVSISQVVSTYGDYFNVYKAFEPKSKIKSKPTTISIFWDASLSMKYRNEEEEFSLLNNYFEYLENVEVDLIVFSNIVLSKQRYSIINGNWQNLKNDLMAVKYDGGTSYLQLPKTNDKEILFFTDGMFNLGTLKVKNNANLYSINAVNSANHEFLSRLSQQNNGKYINLNKVSANQGFNELKTESYKFLGFAKNKHITEVYPNKGAVVDLGFSVSGHFNESTEIELLFGYDDKVEERIKVNLSTTNFNNLPKRLWAKKKLIYLNFDKDENKDAIIKLAKKHHLISDYTSLIVLDRIEDYLRYKIEPPIELKSEYKERLASVESEDKIREEDIKERKEDLIDEYKELKKWYKTRYPIKKKTLKNNKQQNSQNGTQQSNSVNQNSNSNTAIVENTNTTRTSDSRLSEVNENENYVMGIISSASDGIPLPGANIVIKGTSRGVQSDFDGKYALNTEPNETLLVSYLGFISTEVSLDSNSRIIDIALSEDSSNLDEVVVMGYGTTAKQSMTASVSVVSESVSVTESLRALNGQVSGVAITNTNGNPGSSTNIVLRGYSSLNTNNPLYIVDGKIVEDYKSQQIETDSIHSMTVIKDANAQSLYGSRGANGVIVITTKKGLEENDEEIKALNEKIYNNIEFKPWNPDSDYIKILSVAKDVKSAYSKYLELRIKYRNTPSFFIDVADFFESKNDNELAIRVLSNLAEIDIDNHEVLRALAYKLEYFKQYDLALSVYKEILNLRPEEPQSTRDLALAYENVGMYQKAFDLLYSIIEGKLLEKDENERFYGIEHIAFIEAGHLLKKYKNMISLTKTQKICVFPVSLDLRIVADWNHNDTDLDLWVDNPKDQRVSYKNKTTDYGDRLSEDMTEGYGPEEYLIKKGLKGDYSIEVDYYADNMQKISGPTILKITIYKNYGEPNEDKEIRVLRLSGVKDADVIEVGKINF